jgi:hypothetical protein
MAQQRLTDAHGCGRRPLGDPLFLPQGRKDPGKIVTNFCTHPLYTPLLTDGSILLHKLQYVKVFLGLFSFFLGEIQSLARQPPAVGRFAAFQKAVVLWKTVLTPVVTYAYNGGTKTYFFRRERPCSLPSAETPFSAF